MFWQKINFTFGYKHEKKATMKKMTKMVLLRPFVRTSLDVVDMFLVWNVVVDQVLTWLNLNLLKMLVWELIIYHLDVDDQNRCYLPTKQRVEEKNVVEKNKKSQMRILITSMHLYLLTQLFGQFLQTIFTLLIVKVASRN